MAVGVLSLDIDGISYPSAEWRDMPVVVLAAFCQALVGVLAHTAASARVHFMEGPFLVDFHSTFPRVCELKILRRSQGYEVIASGSIDPVDFSQSALSASAEVIRACNERGWNSVDVESLDRAFLALSAQVLTYESRPKKNPKKAKKGPESINRKMGQRKMGPKNGPAKNGPE